MRGADQPTASPALCTSVPEAGPMRHARSCTDEARGRLDAHARNYRPEPRPRAQPDPSPPPGAVALRVPAGAGRRTPQGLAHRARVTRCAITARRHCARCPGGLRYDYMKIGRPRGAANRSPRVLSRCPVGSGPRADAAFEPPRRCPPRGTAFSAGLRSRAPGRPLSRLRRREPGGGGIA